MKTFEAYKTMISVMVGDENQKRYSVDMIRTGLQLALKDYDCFLPKRAEKMVRIMPINHFQFFVPWMNEPDQAILGIRFGRQSGSDGQRFRSVDTFHCQHMNQGLLFTIRDPNFDTPIGGEVRIECSEPHTITNLRDTSPASVPDSHMEILCGGGSGYAMQIRAASIAEVCGQQIEDCESLIRQSAVLIRRFLQDLEALSITQGGNPYALPTAGFPVDC